MGSLYFVQMLLCVLIGWVIFLVYSHLRHRHCCLKVLCLHFYPTSDKGLERSMLYGSSNRWVLGACSCLLLSLWAVVIIQGLNLKVYVYLFS